MVSIECSVKTMGSVDEQEITFIFRIMQTALVLLPMPRLRHTSKYTNSTQQEYSYKSLHHAWLHINERYLISKHRMINRCLSESVLLDNLRGWLYSSIDDLIH